MQLIRGDEQIATTKPDDGIDIDTAWDDFTVQIDTDLGNAIVTLPDSTTVPQGFAVTVCKNSADANPINFDVQGGDTLDTDTTLSNEFEKVTYALVDKDAGLWKAVWNYFTGDMVPDGAEPFAVAADGPENANFNVDPVISGNVYEVDVTGGDVTATLPNIAANSLPVGWKVSFVIAEAGAGSNRVLPVGSGGDTVIGSIDANGIQGAGTSVTMMVFDGTRWASVAESIVNPTPVGMGGTGGLLPGSARENLVIFPNGDFDSTNTNENPGAGDVGKLYVFDTSGGALQMQLPSIAAAGNAWYIWARCDGGNTLTILPDGAETIDGAASLVLTDGQCVLLVAGSATTWRVVANVVTGGIGGNLGSVDNQVPVADGTGGLTLKSGPLNADPANNTVILGSGGNARGAGAVDMQQSRTDAGDVAAGARAFIGGGKNNRASGDDSGVLACINALANAAPAATIAGEDVQATAQYALAQGLESLASEVFAMAFGRHAQANHYGEIAIGGKKIANVGDRQFGMLIFAGRTSDATETELTLLDEAGKYFTVAPGDVVFFSQMFGLGVASASVWAAWGSPSGWAVVLSNNGGTTAITGGAVQLAPFQNVGGSAMRIRFAADDTNDRLAFKVQGIAATTVDWLYFFPYTLIKRP